MNCYGMDHPGLRDRCIPARIWLCFQSYSFRGCGLRLKLLVVNKKAACMKKVLARVTVAAAITFGLIGGSVEAWAERRVALVVGNATYAIANISLTNPRNDAEDVSAALKTLGFEVFTSVNATRHDMDVVLQRFARLATDADAALFFYAGHAMQFQGRNYLMPTDAELAGRIGDLCGGGVSPTRGRAILLKAYFGRRKRRCGPESGVIG
jgi:hypothetical protein